MYRWGGQKVEEGVQVGGYRQGVNEGVVVNVKVGVETLDAKEGRIKLRPAWANVSL